jgi:hypothetical protein
MVNRISLSTKPNRWFRNNESSRKRRLGIEDLESRVLLSVTEPGTLNRPADPVVLLGTDVPSLAGIAPGDLIAFRDTGSGWQQIPIQVDERALVTMYQIYGQTYSHPNMTILTYTDADTFVGPDPDATLDADDEIVFMAKDTGGRVPLWQAAPSDVDAETRLEIRVTDPVDAGLTGWVYLFRRSSSEIDPGAGISYVDYQFNLLVGDGDYQTNYDTLSGPNPENSTVETAYYSRRFTERWVTDTLRINAGTGVDLLDRHKFQFAPGFGGRTEDTFSAAEGAFIINKSGPVRALRSWVGANSGPYTQREEVYYEQREDVLTYLRVHAIPAGMDLFDYNAAASGMIYYNDLNQAGVVVDGQPDSVTPGPIQWELLAGTQGSLSISHVLDTNLPGFSFTSYYLDDTTPPSSDTQVSGDSQAWGQSGPWLQNLASTDVGSSYYLTARRALYYSAPGATVAVAERNDSLVRNPLQAAVDTSPPASSTMNDRHIFYNQSAFDGNDAAIDPTNDNAAIATDKDAYLPNGATAVFGNVTSYSRGINGIMVDLSGVGNHSAITASDFTFKVGNNNAPSTWAAAPDPSAVSVVLGGGVGGSNRVIVTWPNGAIRNQWLEVQMLANANTGMITNDVFFWGNKAGDSGTATPATTFATNTADSLQVFSFLGGGKPITDLRDYNRDGQVSTTDSLLVFANLGSIVRLNVGPAGPFAPNADPAVASDDRSSAVASALARTRPWSATALDPSPTSHVRESSHRTLPPPGFAQLASAGEYVEAPRRRAPNAPSVDQVLESGVLDDLLGETLP